ncbi:hypothetical protein BCU84_10930 [Shewanella sp. 10N.286.51.B7]|uniref:GntR family transcriptional regulator n=1 Tax=Shewanella sp. 10N.286.51.B7 TaxID=1880836 RepID=UPI000CC69306|nr:GntR family transcriptional regulator [Shewanella sp. 10N.286.51.B7]PMG77316.1 hypothetical protein BCU84_10930 [Shewanella sp. 10N.286.51.B7]
MTVETIRFEKMLESDPALKELVGYLKINFNVGEKLPSERDLAELIIGYSRQKIREALIRLECFGYVEISHGKASILLTELS